MVAAVVAWGEVERCGKSKNGGGFGRWKKGGERAVRGEKGRRRLE